MALGPAEVGAMIPIVAILTGGAIAIFRPLAHAHAKRLNAGAPTKITSDVAMRLERIEQSVEAIALEVERISEGQRFVTKLMSERPAAALQHPAQPAGVGSAASPVPTAPLPPNEQRS